MATVDGRPETVAEIEQQVAAAASVVNSVTYRDRFVIQDYPIGGSYKRQEKGVCELSVEEVSNPIHYGRSGDKVAYRTVRRTAKTLERLENAGAKFGKCTRWSMVVVTGDILTRPAGWLRTDNYGIAIEWGHHQQTHLCKAPFFSGPTDAEVALVEAGTATSATVLKVALWRDYMHRYLPLWERVVKECSLHV